MDQIPQIIGAILILTAFAAIQRDWMSPRSRIYLTLNLIGAAVLTGVALDERDWGFFLLNAVWTLVSAWGLARAVRGRTASTAHSSAPDH
jgi:hypothetical protein